MEDIFLTDDLWARAQGIASWTEKATYIVQPISPDLTGPNQVRTIGIEDPSGIPGFLKETREIFGQYGIKRYQIRIDERSRPRDLGKALLEEGFKEREDRVFVISNPPTLPQLPVHILEAEAGSVMRDFETINDRVNTVEMDAIGSIQMAEVRKFRRETGLLKEFVAYFKGEACCTICLIMDRDMIYLKELKMLGEFKGEGIERALISGLVIEYLSKGAKLAWTFTEDVGGEESLLTDLGFSPVASVASYHWYH